ncbi:site-2 protease family protein [candidate division GN15 bacterium]|nr:site-2 protease family protein [candidate division GN15 bacterium]
MFGEEFLRAALIGGPVILFSLTVHEYFHAWSALRFGDTTARDLGRLTLDPLKHLSLTGTLVMVLSQFTFGWAKPVPVNLMNVSNPRKADFWISFAGPLSNIGLALIAGLAFHVFSPAMGGTAWMFLRYAVIINLALAFFNLIPLFPLDGSHILRSVLPPRYEESIARLEQFAPFILILLVITGGVWMIIGGPVTFFYSLLVP